MQISKSSFSVAYVKFSTLKFFARVSFRRRLVPVEVKLYEIIAIKVDKGRECGTGEPLQDFITLLCAPPGPRRLLMRLFRSPEAIKIILSSWK